jgi:hypothetical protein
MRQSSAFLSGIAVASAFFLGLGMQSISGRGPEDGGGGTYAISSDVREFLQHVSMVDLQIDDQGHTARAARITGINLQIVNGMGVTQSFNATGNLIVGYNEYGDWYDHDRRGSHNIICGEYNGYSNAGCLAVGSGNHVELWSAAIGCRNRAENAFCAAIAGCYKQPAGRRARLWEGSNTASGTSTVAGGWLCQATGNHATVSGGDSNVASGLASWVGGGSHTKLG